MQCQVQNSETQLDIAKLIPETLRGQLKSQTNLQIKSLKMREFRTKT